MNVRTTAVVLCNVDWFCSLFDKTLEAEPGFQKWGRGGGGGRSIELLGTKTQCICMRRVFSFYEVLWSPKGAVLEYKDPLWGFKVTDSGADSCRGGGGGPPPYFGQNLYI